jgi:ATP-binding protein involved in chromosome partitioning
MGDMSAPAPTVESAIQAALAGVQDPEIRRPITELGMVRSVEVNAEGVATIGILLTVAGCPLKDKLTSDVTAA